MRHEVLLRRTGIVPDAEPSWPGLTKAGGCNGPGSAPHRFASAARCAASGERKLFLAALPPVRRVIRLVHRELGERGLPQMLGHAWRVQIHLAAGDTLCN